MVTPPSRDSYAGVVECLLEALAAQVDASDPPRLVDGAARALQDLSRATTRALFGWRGELVHYGGHPEIALVLDLITQVHRDRASAALPWRPGDRVTLTAPVPRQTVFTVRYAGSDGTVDVQPDLTEDYLLETVPHAALAKVGEPR